MRKQLIYGVELKDLNTWTFFPGATEFMSLFNGASSAYGYYTFDVESSECIKAERMLLEKGLGFVVTPAIGLTMEETVSYPAFYLSIPLPYDLIAAKKGIPLVNATSLGSSVIAEDFSQGIVVARKKVVNQLHKLGAGLECLPTFTTRQQPIYILPTLPELVSSVVYPTITGVEEGQGQFRGTFDPVGGDGQVVLTTEALSQLATQHLVQAPSFAFQGQGYKRASSVHFVSGAFAQWLLTSYGDKVQVTPVVLSTVWNQ